jgi:hypothetical protein
MVGTNELLTIEGTTASQTAGCALCTHRDLRSQQLSEQTAIIPAVAEPCQTNMLRVRRLSKKPHGYETGINGTIQRIK